MTLKEKMLFFTAMFDYWVRNTVIMGKPIAYFTNMAPHYRRRLWLKMLNDDKIEFHFFYGRPSKGGICEIEFDREWMPLLKHLHKIRNVRFKSFLFYQVGVISRVLFGKWEAVIFLGDMYIISNWIAAFLAKARGLKVYFWGHGMYGNESLLKRLLRKSFLQLADKHLLYGHHARNQMIKAGFAPENLIVVYNSLDYDKHVSLRQKLIDPNYYLSQQFFRNNNLPILIFIGRLTPQKQLGNLIDALQRLNFNMPTANLMIVGDGSEKNNLQKKAESVKENICFYGACYDEYEIGKLLANADLCVSPGNVGLTAIHSLSFGTPICTHSDLSEQMPEAEAITSEKTGIFYNRKNSDDLVRAIKKWVYGNRNRDEIRKNCYKVIDSQYNPHVQLDIFKHVLLQN